MMELRRAIRIFRKAGQHDLAHACHVQRGIQCDSRNPNETEAWRLIGLANGATTV